MKNVSLEELFIDEPYYYNDFIDTELSNVLALVEKWLKNLENFCFYQSEKDAIKWIITRIKIRKSRSQL